jgi:hypothetical protein
MFENQTDLNKQLDFWFRQPAMYFVPELPPNLESAVQRVVRKELEAERERQRWEARFREQPWYRRILSRGGR